VEEQAAAKEAAEHNSGGSQEKEEAAEGHIVSNAELTTQHAISEGLEAIDDGLVVDPSATS
jgi:hypothetical protein